MQHYTLITLLPNITNKKKQKIVFLSPWSYHRETLIVNKVITNLQCTVYIVTVYSVYYTQYSGSCR